MSDYVWTETSYVTGRWIHNLKITTGEMLSIIYDQIVSLRGDGDECLIVVVSDGVEHHYSLKTSYKETWKEIADQIGTKKKE